MTAGADDLADELRARVEQHDRLERLADRIGATVQVSAIFGEPVERGHTTVIPVAKATWGIGGGGGGEGAEGGAGGGGAARVSPLGYIELRESGAAFKRIHDPLPLTVAVATAIGLGALVARAVGRR